MILTLLPNPALDKTAVIPGFLVGAIHRPSEVMVQAGGKGFNFARALRTLGEQALVVAPLGGIEGQRLRVLADEDGIAVDGVGVDAALRTCLSILDPAHGNQLTEIYERGAPLTASEWARCVDCAVHHFAEARFLAVCGSFPPGVPEHGLREVLDAANARGVPVLLDTAGLHTIDALQRGPLLLKVNRVEAEALLGHSITSSDEANSAAEELRALGARSVVITLGKIGATGLTSDGERFGWALPVVSAVSAVGSGDCTFAGIAAGLAQGQSLPEATRLGVAAGAANTLQLGAGKFDPAEVARLLPLVESMPSNAIVTEG